MMLAAHALFVGDVGLDTTVTVNHVPEPDEKVLASAVEENAGGVVANAAVACHRAGVGARLVCVTGDDLAGGRVVAQLKASGVAVQSRVAGGVTCRALIVLEPAGEKRLILIPGVSMYPSLDQVKALALSGSAWVHTAAYDLDAAALLADRCRTKHLPWSVDLEPATYEGKPARLGAVLTGASVVFVNARAARELGPDPVGWLFDHGVQAVILSRGAEGAVWVTPATRACARSSEAVGPVVDTSGAGDCLAGWFIAETLAGSEPVTALQVAVTAASLSCGRLGAQASYPHRVELQSLLDPSPGTAGATR